MNKLTLGLGIVLSILFFIVLGIMFHPIWGNKDAFNAADDLFNSISKGSSYFIPSLKDEINKIQNSFINVKLHFKSKATMEDLKNMLLNCNIVVGVDRQKLIIQDDLKKILTTIVNDCDRMYLNRGMEISNKYSINEKKTMYNWWKFLGVLNKELNLQKKFKLAKLVKKVKAKGVEVAYNYYGIVPEDASNEAKVLTLALIFYVIYTIWWGYALMFLLDGLGFKMKAGAKKEI